jgi:hypothetical protein
MAFTGGLLACPNCRLEISLRDRYAWRVGSGQYKCPACGHQFPGRDFIDAGTPIRIFDILHGTDSLDDREARTVGLGTHAPRVGVEIDWLESQEDRIIDLEREFGVQTRKIAEHAEHIEQHSAKKVLLHLCILADTLDHAIRRLQAYSRAQGQSVKVVVSAQEVIGALAGDIHVVVDITSGLRWLPSKILLDSKWGDHLIYDDNGVVFAGESDSVEREDATFPSRSVPEESYLHFFCDRPFNPPGWFLERVAGRVLDFQSRHQSAG